jgi:hypothetical protein
MGKTFRNIHLASTSDFPPDKNDKIKGWVKHAGGKFAKHISKDVTHLVASKHAWKQNAPMGKFSAFSSFDVPFILLWCT